MSKGQKAWCKFRVLRVKQWRHGTYRINDAATDDECRGKYNKKNVGEKLMLTIHENLGGFHEGVADIMKQHDGSPNVTRTTQQLSSKNNNSP